jgi:hypothetical protein
VAGSCEHVDELFGSGATELFIRKEMGPSL